MLDPEYLADILTSPVCSCHNDCSGFWSRELWKRMHEPILEYTQNRRSFIKWMHCYIMTSFWNADTNSFQFSVGGRDVCPVAFCAFWHLTRYTFELITKCIREGLDLPVHGNLGQDRDSIKEQMCEVYLTKLERVSEHQPDTEEIHLVEKVKKIDVYEAMAEGEGVCEFY
jgi:hypothetical protein